MKELFERHQQRLSASERRAVWEKISSVRGSASPRRWAVPALAGAAGMVILAVLVFHHGPAPVLNPPSTGASKVAERSLGKTAAREPATRAERNQAAPGPNEGGTKGAAVEHPVNPPVSHLDKTNQAEPNRKEGAPTVSAPTNPRSIRRFRRRWRRTAPNPVPRPGTRAPRISHAR